MLKKAFWLFGIAVLLLIIFLPGYTKLQELRERNNDLEKKMRDLNINNYLLTEELKRVKSDTLYQENVARQKMGVVRKGEVPIKVIPEESR
ncbi:MAG: hypothetical protein C4533_01295 [Candidatus Omnitrophota bacterium]|jgi:cell division protein FtsB|nr:MAG: hypothetical protein C4533_01295 [Candidatus Omnitrophota bacterium]